MCGLSSPWQKMRELGKTEEEKAPYREKLVTFSANVLVLEAAAQTREVQAQARYVTVVLRRELTRSPKENDHMMVPQTLL